MDSGEDGRFESWSRTLGVVRGLTTFKRMGRRMKMRQNEEKHLLWKKLALRMKILNILSTKYYKRDLRLQTDHEAAMVQANLEKCLGSTLSFKLKPGDLVINEFE